MISPAPAGAATRVSARIAAITESATLAVDAKAKALKAAGRPVIGFGAGEPDFPTPDYIVEAAVEACRDPRNHRYTPAGGLPELKEAVAAKTARDSGFQVEAGQVLITNGGKQAVYQTFAALLDPGDEVLMPTPFWTTYPESIALAGGVPVEVLADETTGYRVSVEQLEAARTPRTKVLLFVSPSNPTGAVYSPEAVREIGRWAHANGLWVVTDEIYEHLVYGDATFSSIVTEVPELADTCVVVNGVAKTYAMTGWRVGWMIGPKDVIKAAANLQSHATSNVSNVSQRAALAAVAGDLSAVADMRAAFDRRRRTMVSMLNEIDGVFCPVPEGAFYAYPSVKDVLGRTIAGRTPKTSAELAELILEEAEVAVVPGEAFGPSGYLRLSYALGDDDLAEGVGRIQRLLG
ncbi:aspartate/methionine/tyrosine aminotransferase [Jiangella mangrovi]|uniref:Aminotransferase n=2 Tax=Jiangella mangrovi TaxID=1524084 RepID=A0A7W9GQB4_9ACTN|nr:pyridoxal phosphate-dependent aminotransferase [Jiangella mangrovi]MBB5788090.1 aspartate/methionine/tyrosine aminotransferase [Jiangella mangrovi]